MKKILFALNLVLISSLGFSQITGIIKDSETEKPIPYVNIWIADEGIGTTSNINGEFSLSNPKTSKTIVLSAIGYKSERIEYNLGLNIIELEPQIFNLPEVIVKSKKRNKILKIGKFRRGQISIWYGGSLSPFILARFFPYDEKYNKTPFLKSIKLLTKSYIDNAKYNIRLYSVNKKGEPEGYIYQKNILVKAKKRKSYIVINLEDYNIPFPKKGFFVAVEWLVIDENKSIREVKTSKISKKTKIHTSVNPFVATIPAETNKNSYFFIKGNWRKKNKDRFENTAKRYKNKYLLLAAELTLTN